MIHCVAVIGKDNKPLYSRTFEDSEPLRLQFVVYAALDAFEERAVDATRKAEAHSAAPDPFLGMVTTVEEFSVYGLHSNTGIKFVAVTGDAPVRLEHVKTLLRNLQELYVHTASNPFAEVGEEIASKRFDREVIGLVAAHKRVSVVAGGQAAAGAL